MKVGIIGCGYIGSAAARLMLEAGHQVLATTTRESRLGELEALGCDARRLRGSDTVALHSFAKEVQALAVTLAPNSGSSYQETYLETACSLRAVLGARRLPLVYTSSCSVYGDCEGAWVDEDSSLRATAETARVLIETERVYLDELNGCVLRLGGLYGPDRGPLVRLQNSQGQALPGDGSGFTNWTHRDDAARAILWSLEKRLTGAYNVCGDTHTPRRELYAQLCHRYSLPAVEWDPGKSSRHGGNRRVRSEKLKATGFTFSHPEFDL